MAATRRMARIRSCPVDTIATTGSDGFIHQHLFYFLQDNDGDGGTKPADGLYLVAERMKMPGLG